MSAVESIEVKALKYDLIQKDIEITNLKNTIDKLRSEIKHITPTLSELDKFKLTPEYPKFKQEFLDALEKFENNKDYSIWGLVYGKYNRILNDRERSIFDILQIAGILFECSDFGYTGNAKEAAKNSVCMIKKMLD